MTSRNAETVMPSILGTASEVAFVPDVDSPFIPQQYDNFTINALRLKRVQTLNRHSRNCFPGKPLSPYVIRGPNSRGLFRDRAFPISFKPLGLGADNNSE